MSVSPKTQPGSPAAKYRLLRSLGRAALIALAYFLIARSSLFFVFQPQGLAAVWPSSGVALAVLLLSKRRDWPATLVAIFAANTLANFIFGNTLPVSLGFAFANTLEPALGAWILTIFTSEQITFAKLRQVISLFAVAVVVNALSGLLGAAVPAIAFGASYWDVWLTWWVSNGLGILLVTPFIVTWAAPGKLFKTVSPRHIAEGVLLTLLLSGLAWFIFVVQKAENPILGSYYILPLLMWTALRFTPRSSATISIILASIVIWGIVHGLGIFVVPLQSQREHLLHGQLFLSVACFTTAVMVATISERKRVEEALRASEARFRTIYEGTVIGLAFGDPSGRFLDINPALQYILGYRLDELTHKTMADISHPDDLDADFALFQETLQGRRQHYQIEKRYYHKDGHIVWGNTRVFIVRDPGGNPQFAVGMIEDITERKRAEEALVQSEARFSRIFNSSPIPITLSRLTDGVYIDINDSFQRLSGFTREEVIGHTALDLGVYPDPEMRTILLDRFRQRGRLEGHDQPFRTKSGRVVDTLLWLELLSINHEPCILALALDITARKRAEEALRESEEKYRQLFEAVSDAICLVDNVTGQIYEANSAASKIYGYTREELLTMRNFDISIEPERSRKSMEDHATLIPVRWHQKKDGTIFPVEISANHFTWNGHPVHLATIRDITERKRGEDRLRDTLEEKEVLLREVHHRVKNNLQAIIYLIEMHAGRIDQPEIRREVMELQGQARTMSLVYERLFQSENLAQIEMESFLSDLVPNILRMFAGERTIELDVDAAATLDVELAMPCSLIVNELVTNALKHAFPPGFAGAPRIRIALREEEDGYTLLVGDNGVGLPRELDWSRLNSMGLNLVNLWATHQLGGTLAVDTEHGATFHITFPQRR